MPVVTGRKSESEKFAGALRTYATEAMMQDNRALQAGTSHNLGQNFARQFALKFATETGGEEFAWNTSWGVSTRMIGGLVMTHGDDNGLRVPPRLAPTEVVIVPIWKTDDDREAVFDAAYRIRDELGSWDRKEEQRRRIHVDSRIGIKPGAKYYEWELRGVPLRLEIGPRDLAAAQATAVTRHDGTKRPVPLSGLVAAAGDLMAAARTELRARARALQQERTRVVDDRPALEGAVTDGFALARWCETLTCAQEIQEATRATIRCFPLERDATGGTYRQPPDDPGPCAWCGAPARRRAIIARSY
jgi:prolyl-tRNA synthetase